MCNLGIFTTLVYSSPNILKTQGMLKTLSNVWWGVFYRTLCNTGIFRTRGTFRALSNIYYGEFYSKPSITLSYLNTWHIQNPSYILNTAKYLSWNILFKTLCNSETLVFSQLWYILKLKHIQNPAEYLRWNILLRTLCNYSKFLHLTYSKLSLIQNPSVSAAP